ncbi:MAG: peptide chain release factor N(5)-glutamine methyltransferase [Xanthomonadales bacterium]|nr:peptide chain release factor N(5)-glutamine methyltransferase [Xanthomonadales bacterium]
MTTNNIQYLLSCARQKLAGNPSASIDAEVLLAHVLETGRSFLYANPELDLPRNRTVAFKRLVAQRAQGHPIAYLTGSCEFWSLQLDVNPAVLIPRPETELLVEAALSKIPPGAGWRIADLGTGSGAIALALASEHRRCEIHATDISETALDVARGNAARLGFSQLRFHRGCWAEPLDGGFELIVSNPPYVDDDDPHLERGDLRFEPLVALTPGADGLAAIREIIHSTRPWLVPGGWLMFEHGWKQGPASRRILKEDGFTNIGTFQDLQGHDRVTVGKSD